MTHQPAPNLLKAADDVSGSTEIKVNSALDQWRGMALLAVLINHAWKHTGLVEGWGRIGVNLFFFISGILVCRSLRKLPPYGFAALSKRFYRRRFTRLAPAMFFFVFCVFAFGLIIDGLHDPRAGLACLLWLRNEFLIADPITHHLWSVSGEMQFYLLAPFIFWPFRQPRIMSWLLLTAIVAIMLGFGVKGAAYQYFQSNKYGFLSATWPIFLGFYLEWGREYFAPMAKNLQQLLWLLFGVFMIIFIIGQLLALKFLVIFGGSGMLIGCYLSYITNHPLENKAGRFFSWFGQRTYSIYIWQQPFTLAGLLPPSFYPVGVLIAIGLGVLSFQWFEVPFMRRWRRQHPSMVKVAGRTERFPPPR